MRVFLCVSREYIFHPTLPPFRLKVEHQHHKSSANFFLNLYCSFSFSRGFLKSYPTRRRPNMYIIIRGGGCNSFHSEMIEEAMAGNLKRISKQGPKETRGDGRQESGWFNTRKLKLQCLKICSRHSRQQQQTNDVLKSRI